MVIILGNNGYNTLGVIRCLGEDKIKCHIILIKKVLNSKSFVLLSKYSKSYDIVQSEKEAIELLLKNKEQWKNSTIIPTSDTAVCKLDLFQKDLINYYQFPHTGKAGDITTYLNKENQIKLAQKSGLNTLYSIRYNKGEQLPEGIKFPCIAKQIDSTDGHKSGIKKLTNIKELECFINEAQNTNHFLIQEFIEKEYELLFIGCRFNVQDTWIPAFFKKERWEQNGGDGSYGFISNIIEKYSSELDSMKKLLENLDYYGPFSIEFGVKNDTLYFFEINLRNDGTSHYFHKLGVRIPSQYYRFNLNNFIPPKLKKQSYIFIDEIGDYNNVKNKIISFREWIKSINLAKAYKYFSLKDILPSLYVEKRLIKKIIFSLFN